MSDYSSQSSNSGSNELARESKKEVAPVPTGGKGDAYDYWKQRLGGADDEEESEISDDSDEEESKEV